MKAISNEEKVCRIISQFTKGSDRNFGKCLFRFIPRMNKKYGQENVDEALVSIKPFFEDSKSGLVRNYFQGAFERVHGSGDDIVKQYLQESLCVVKIDALYHVIHPNTKGGGYEIQVSVWDAIGSVGDSLHKTLDDAIKEQHLYRGDVEVNLDALGRRFVDAEAERQVLRAKHMADYYHDGGNDTFKQNLDAACAAEAACLPSKTQDLLKMKI